jgi:hypothetical protein
MPGALPGYVARIENEIQYLKMMNSRIIWWSTDIIFFLIKLRKQKKCKLAP